MEAVTIEKEHSRMSTKVHGVCQTDRKFVQYSYPESRKLAG